jgi:uncharacterized membrane protein YciS (DUF1049 family)
MTLMATIFGSVIAVGFIVSGVMILRDKLQQRRQRRKVEYDWVEPCNEYWAEIYTTMQDALLNTKDG